MAADDKIKNTLQDLKGKAEEATGRARGDDEQVAEGEKDQTAANLKQAGEKVKDAFR